MPESKPRVRVPAGRKPFRISESLLSGARGRHSAPKVDPFKLPEFPPGVKPPQNVIAQDEAPINDLFAWAGGFGAFGGFGVPGFAANIGFIGYQYLAQLALIAEYRFMSEIIAGEMTRKWIEFKSKSDDKDQTGKLQDLGSAVKDTYHLDEHSYAVIRDDGFFGRGHLYVDAGVDLDGKGADEELKLPIGDGAGELSKKKVTKGTKLAFQPVEALWAYPTRYESSDPLRKDWYRPNTWYVMKREVHRSRFLTMIARPVPDIFKPAFAFGGISLSQLAQPYVNRWLQTVNSVSQLIHAFTVWVVKTNLGAWTQEDGQTILNRVDFFNALRDNQGAAVVDNETEDVTNVSAPLGGLHDLQAQSQEHLFSVSRIPGVKFAGITPTGLNASSEGEIRAFYDTIHDFQERLLRPLLTPCINFVQLAEFGEVDEDIVFDFPSLWELDEAAESAVQQTKAATHEFYLTEGVVAPAEVRKAVAADPHSPYAGLDIGEEPPPTPEEHEEEEAAMGGEKPHESPNVERMERVAEGFGSPETGGFKGDIGIGDEPTISQSEADYVPHPVDGERCKDCSMFLFPSWCTLVSGKISSAGHCKHWEPLFKAEAAE